MKTSKLNNYFGPSILLLAIPFLSGFSGLLDITRQKPLKTFSIRIDRKIKSDSCTQGYILVNDKVIAYSLELPDKNNQQYISSIPKGTYAANIRTDGSLGWRIELQGVPDRDHVQIHVGNYTRQIKGCILIGTTVDIDNCNVTNNFRHEAITLLQKALNDFTKDLILNKGSNEPVNIEVEITGI